MWRSNSIRGAAVAALLGFLAVDAGLAQYQLFDDFETTALGPVAGQDGWYSSGGDNRIMPDPVDPLNQALYVPSESSILRKALLYEGIVVPDGTVRMLFLRMRAGNRQTLSLGLSGMSAPSEYSDFATEVGLTNNAPGLDLRVWDDDGGNYEELAQLAPDTWYNVWVRVNTLANEFEVWINDVPGGAARAIDSMRAADGDATFTFRSGSGSAMLTFYVKTSGGSSGENFGPVYLDDIHIEATDALNLSNPTAPCVGDSDADGDTDLSDLARVLGDFGCDDGICPGDLDQDGATGLSDLALVLADFGCH